MHEMLMMVTKDLPMKIIPIDGKPYLERYYVGTDEHGCQHWLHRILIADSERWLHTHPFNAISKILDGWYNEERAIGGHLSNGTEFTLYEVGSTNRISVNTLHRIAEAQPNTWSWLAVRPGRKENWKFINDAGDEEIRRSSSEGWHKEHGNREAEYAKFNLYRAPANFKCEWGALQKSMFSITPKKNTGATLEDLSITFAEASNAITQSFLVPKCMIRDNKADADLDLLMYGQSFLKVEPADEVAKVMNFGGYVNKIVKELETTEKSKRKVSQYNWGIIVKMSNACIFSAKQIVEIFESAQAEAKIFMCNTKCSNKDLWDVAKAILMRNLFSQNGTYITDLISQLENPYGDDELSPKKPNLCKSTLGVISRKPEVKSNEIDTSNRAPKISWMKFKDINIGSKFYSSTGREYLKIGKFDYKLTDGSNDRVFVARGDRINAYYRAEEQ